ncbi:hypothetical protein RR46_15287 [Papilio xuthus]|uniref:Uncharacterized protein n=1 Tax=Papilio xuthus TaxID=66420 RepID=A0A194PFI3_PAPXU|nr:hypothetical protein RR46_15287 [Papilio xuthus]
MRGLLLAICSEVEFRVHGRAAWRSMTCAPPFLNRARARSDHQSAAGRARNSLAAILRSTRSPCAQSNSVRCPIRARSHLENQLHL